MSTSPAVPETSALQSPPIRPMTSRFKVPVPCWAWCYAGGYDQGWWKIEKRLDLFTIGSLSYYHPDQPEAPTVRPLNEHSPHAEAA